MKMEMETDLHVGAGPVTNVYGHGPVTLVNRPKPNGDMEMEFAVCLDCGYLSHDLRQFMFEDCDRPKNPINQTWRERLEEDGLDSLDG